MDSIEAPRKTHNPIPITHHPSMLLNEEQQIVVQTDWRLALKVVAGAGTGKTETLAARFVELVHGGVSPARMLLLTFTEEAAAEMRARVLLRLRQSMPDLSPAELVEPWCHTFHGFAMRLLRQYGWAISLPPAPRVLDSLQQQTLLAELVVDWEEQRHDGRYQPLTHHSYRWDNGEAWNRALEVLRRLRSSGATPAELEPHPQLRAEQETRFGAERAQLVPLIEYAYNAYSKHLRQSGILDYDELISAACRLLDRMPALREQFAVVMVDEFQDTNPAQLDLLARLRPDWSATTIVGDPRQAIYGWRLARPESLRRFPYDLHRPAVDQPLRHNYRSHAAICHIANLALARSEFAVEAPLVAGRITIPEHPALLGVPVALHHVSTVEDEARLVADTMAGLIASGVPAQDIALLLRARTRLDAFTTALQAANVPYTVRGGTGYFLQPPVRLIASLLQFLHDPEDRSAAAHVFESPLVGIHLALLGWRSSRSDIAAADVFHRWLLDPSAVPEDLPNRAEIVARMEPFATFASAVTAHSLVQSPADFLVWLFAASGLQNHWRKQEDWQALRDLDKLVALADQWRLEDPTLTVSAYTDLLRERVADLPPEAIPIQHAPDAVEIATVHGAKGREWPVVFVADTALPPLRARQVEHVLWDEQWKLVISDGKTSGKRGAPDPLSDLRRDLRRRARNEERAIWYVALTRARDRLIVTHSGCELDDDGHFEDARHLVEHDDAGEHVHFFHELWELVRAEPEGIRETVTTEARRHGGDEVMSYEL